MGRLILEAPDDLTPGQWDEVLRPFEGHPMVEPLKRLRELKNVPQAASTLFVEPSLVNQNGSDYINGQFRKANLPYRLTRIGTWMCEGYRGNRTLAVVPWPYKKKNKPAA